MPRDLALHEPRLNRRVRSIQLEEDRELPALTGCALVELDPWPFVALLYDVDTRIRLVAGRAQDRERWGRHLRRTFPTWRVRPRRRLSGPPQ